MPKRIRKGLTPARIVEAACVIVDEKGVEGLSMRPLARALGVAPMAIYNHFADRDTLLSAVAEETLGNVAIPKRRGGWREQIVSIVEGMRRLATKHPHLYALAMTRPTKPAAGFALMFAALAALRKAGLEEAEAVQWYHTILMLLQGYPHWRSNMERYRSGRGRMMDAQNLPAETKADWRTVYSINPDRQFKKSLDGLLDAIEIKRIGNQA